jgi:hypothetical protein
MERVAYHLRGTEAALSALLAAHTFITIERAWTQVISEGYAVLDKLILAPETGREKQWAGSVIRRDMRQDPLVTYCHQARNAYHHGVRQVFERKAASPELWVDGVPIVDFEIPKGMVPGRLNLIAVENRGKTYDLPAGPPRLPQPNCSPGSVAIAFIDYLREKFTEASSFN